MSLLAFALTLAGLLLLAPEGRHIARPTRSEARHLGSPWASVLAVGLVGVVVGSPFIALVGPLIIVAARAGMTRRRQLREAKELRQSIIAMVDAMILDVNSGQSLAVAVSAGLEATDQAVHRRLAAGEPIERAIESGMGVHPDLDLVLLSVRVIETSGGPSGVALARLADTLRHRHRSHDERAAQSSQATSSAVVMAALPFAFGTIVALLNGDVAAFYLRQWGGAICALVASSLVLAGLAWIDRVMHQGT